MMGKMNLSFISIESVKNQFCTDLYTPVGKNIDVPGTTIHVFYAKKWEMLIGIIELISERIAKLDRLLPRKRLLRGFGSLTLGGILGAVISIIGVITVHCDYWMLLGSVLCAVFAGLLYKGYRKVEG